jgi:hypothetical protein
MNGRALPGRLTVLGGCSRRCRRSSAQLQAGLTDGIPTSIRLRRCGLRPPPTSSLRCRAAAEGRHFAVLVLTILTPSRVESVSARNDRSNGLTETAAQKAYCLVDARDSAAPLVYAVRATSSGLFFFPINVNEHRYSTWTSQCRLCGPYAGRLLLISGLLEVGGRGDDVIDGSRPCPTIPDPKRATVHIRS